MVSQEEKMIFGLLGAMTAVMVGLAVFGDAELSPRRTPASIEDPQPDSLYFYYID